jgi:hypothetical protein
MLNGMKKGEDQTKNILWHIRHVEATILHYL